MPRLFVAIDPTDAQQAKLAGVRDDAIRGRWTPPHHYHLTLRFIGEVDEENAVLIEQALAGLDAEAFTLHGEGIGVFPSPRRPRVLFAAVHPAPALLTLQTRIQHTLRAIGFDDDPKPFRPHITLARLRRADPQTVRAFLHTHRAFTLDPFAVHHYALYQSVLRRDGAVHTKRAAYTLRDP